MFARDLGHAMERLGHSVSLIALVAGDDRPGLPAHVLGSRVKSAPSLWSLYSRMSEADITVAHGPDAGWACARVSNRSTPFVYRQVRDTRGWERRPKPQKKVPSHFSKATAVVAMSPGARTDLIQLVDLDPSKVAVIPLGVPSDRFRGPSPAERRAARQQMGADGSEFVAVTVGNLHQDKGIEHAIRTVAELERVRLVVVGDGPDRERLERLSEALVGDRVVFAGAVPDVQRAYFAADVVLHPSVAGDSMPAVVVEAGLCETVAVATAIGSTDEIVEDGVTGLLVEPGSADAIRLALEQFGSGAIRREQMGAAARRRCLERFDIDVVAKEWMELLHAEVA